MKIIKTYKKFLSKENKDFINNVLLGNNFPYYLSEYDVNHPHDDKIPSYKILCHTVLQRKEDRKLGETFNSVYTNQTLSILSNFFKKTKIDKVNFFRIAYNYTFNIGVKKSYIHVDHEHDHQQAIIYLTDTLDKNTPTVIVNDKGKTLEKCYPEKDKGIIFPKKPHYHIFPKKGARLVLVATFEEIK